MNILIFLFDCLQPLFDDLRAFQAVPGIGIGKRPSYEHYFTLGEHGHEKWKVLGRKSLEESHWNQTMSFKKEII